MFTFGFYRFSSPVHLEKNEVYQFCLLSLILMSKQFRVVMDRASKNSKRTKTGKKSVKSKKNKTDSLCEICGKSFSKNSNLSSHFKKVHQGLRWRCHLCGADQVSKHSHKRHYESRHNGEVPANIKVNQRYVAHFIEMPEEAKNAIIAELNEKIQVQRVLLKSFRKRLLATLKSNIELKCQLEVDCENEKLEYDSLLGNGEESEDSDDEDEEDSAENVESLHEKETQSSVGTNSKREEIGRNQNDDDSEDDEEESGD